MARRPVEVPKAPLRATFYLNAGVDADRLGAEVKTDDNGVRSVQFTAAEAQYWLDQGAIFPVKPEVVQQRRQDRQSAARESTVRLTDQPAPAAKNADPADRLSGAKKAR